MDVVADLSDVVAQINETVDQSSENLNVITSVFSSTADLASSGNLTVPDQVSESSIYM